MNYSSHSVQQTEAIAGELAAKLRAGDCLALIGELGAGKTQFVRGLVRALGGDGRRVSSPTFVLLNIYPTPSLRVYHLDAYRLHSAEDLEAIGFSELLEQRGLVVVEWADRIAALLPPDAMWIRITATGRNDRTIAIDKAP